ncbi:ribokinase [Micromonospora sp. NPDC005324]|uniref:ribokinase n=1 Tax=Micromonospora sp. NPDC005324 TaxID=3157033 RepID=UPI0033B107AD
MNTALGTAPPATSRRPVGRVVVVGSINDDLVFSVDALPSWGQTSEALRVSRLPGGKGANQAVAAARFGAEVHIIGAVGDDEAAGIQLDALRREGVGIGGVYRVSGTSTGMAVVLSVANGENMIVLASGANHRLDQDRAEASLEALALTASDVCLISCEIPAAVVDLAVRHAADRGARVVVNPAPARKLGPLLLAAHPILTPNAVELVQLCELHQLPHDPVALSRLTGAPVLVTRGRDGAELASDGTVRRFAAVEVAAVDTTGAGDTLSGTLCARLAAGVPLNHAAAEAVSAASRSVTAVGARAGMPTLEMVRPTEPATFAAPVEPAP